MIRNPKKQDLIQLIGQESGLCVTLLMPTHSRGRDITENRVRFKNLIAQSISKVGDRSDAVKARLENLAKLEHDQDFWQHQSAGYALFVCENHEQHFALPHAPDETVSVANHFYVSSIASSSCGGRNALALALSWDHARLFASDGHHTQELLSDSFPVTFEDLVTERDPEEQLQYSTHSVQGGGRSGPRAGSTAMFHGHGEGEHKIEADREQFLSRVGDRLSGERYNTEDPLIVVATEEVAGHFGSKINDPAATMIHASPDGLNDQDLLQRIGEAAHPLLRESTEQLTAKVEAAIANNAGSKEIEEIVKQAAAGRVDTLLVDQGESIHGSFDRESQFVKRDNNADTDLVNLAVRETLLAGGSVASAGKGGLAAIYRY